MGNRLTKRDVVDELRYLVSAAHFVDSDYVTSPFELKYVEKAIELLDEDYGADYFENHSCPHYPCHRTEHINCLFCMCPLYSLEDCGGNYSVLDNGVKDCSNCLFPHIRDNYPKVQEKLREICENGAREGRWKNK